MSASAGNHPFPRGALLGAAALIGVTLVAVASGRLAGFHAGSTPAAETAVESHDLRFSDRADGAVVVADATSGRVVEVLAPGTNGFVRAVLRGLARERRREEIGREPPFQLTRWSDGRLSLSDTSTGQEITLQAFGPTNSQAFAQLLTAADGGAMIKGWAGGRRTLKVPCTLDLENTEDSLHAYVELDGVDIHPGDEVLVHDAPTEIGLGQKIVCRRDATIVQAGWLERAWTRLAGRLELTELYEVGFSSWRRP